MYPSLLGGEHHVALVDIANGTLAGPRTKQEVEAVGALAAVACG
jgi:hypothetical protein